MFQSFEPPLSGRDTPTRLKNIRTEMARKGVAAFLVPRADVHQGEYVAPADERLAWVSGFTGSAGFSVITETKAALFIDGRYRLQARDQLEPDYFELINWPETSLAGWLKRVLSAGRIGFDPALHTLREIEALEDALGSEKSLRLQPVDNLIDRIWAERPAPPAAPICDYPPKYTKLTRAEKITRVAKELAADSVILTQPDSIAWLLNIRGADIVRIPIALAFAIVFKTGQVEVFADGAPPIALARDKALSFQKKSALWERLGTLSGAIQIDPHSVPYLVKTLLTGAELVYADDPCRLLKACKDEAEIAAARTAHLYDGVAMVRFLFWLDGQNGFSEIDAVKRLEACRAESGNLRDISFDTIAGLGPNGAIIHYRVTTQTNRRAAPHDILLIDSGGQYLGGTTDITRTIAIGTPSAEQKHFFTLVLKGMISLSMARWPRGLSGRDLDPLARQFLRAQGDDYDHGTGHGVGSYLSVHEGPQRISKLGGPALEAGMILSNEPGYYREGAFGIRIENLLLVRAADSAQGRNMLGFETLTLAPIDQNMIDTRLLAFAEKEWLNAYHRRVYKALTPLLESDVCDWLAKASAPL